MNVHQVFSCGIDRDVFDDRYQAISDDEKERLALVARRVWLTLKLRYEITIIGNPFANLREEFNIGRVELPSIEVYLLCTCLDTLAGSPKFIGFSDWLHKQPNLGELDIDKIAKLYKKWQREHGVGSNLLRLFEELPKSVRDWLQNDVRIRKSEYRLNQGHDDTEKLVERLYTYFYDVWRNAYTHSSLSRHTPIATDIKLPEDGGWWVTPVSGTRFVLDRNKQDERWNLSYREGLDEATILRVIIQAAALQIMGIEPTKETVEEYLRNLSRISGLYSFVGEVNRNAFIANSLSDIRGHRTTELATYMIYVGVPTMGVKASSNMLDRYLDNPLEMGLRQMTMAYLRDVSQINSSIVEFNESNPPPKASGNTDDRWKLINSFVDKMTQSPNYKSILDWPTRTDVTNLWLVVRDPCYVGR